MQGPHRAGDGPRGDAYGRAVFFMGLDRFELAWDLAHSRFVDQARRSPAGRFFRMEC